MSQESINNQIPDDVTLKELLRPLWKRRYQIIFFTLLMTFVVAFYVSLLKPSYKATAILQIGSNKPTNTLSINEAFNESVASFEEVQTQYELLKSRKFAERVVSTLNLTEHPDFNSGKYNEKIPFLAEQGVSESTPSFSNVVGQFRSRLSISPISGTELVKISFTTYSPELAMRAANQIGQTYLQYRDEIHGDSKDKTSQWLVNQLEELAFKLETSEQNLQQYREEQGLVDIQGVLGLINSELTQLTSSALQASKAVDDLKVTYQYIQENKNNFAELTELKQISGQPTYIQLKRAEEQIERKLNELAQRYGPKHPKRIAVVAELDSIKSRIKKHVNDIVTSLEKDYFSAVEKVKVTELRLANSKQDYLRLSRLNNKFSQLKREVETNRELHQNYLMRLREADAMGDYKSDFYVRFIDKALEPQGRVAPNKSLYVLMALVLSAGFVSIIVIMRELFIDTLDSRRKLDSFTEAPIIAVLPKFKRKVKDGEQNEQPIEHRFVEAIRSLRTSLLFSGEQKPPKVIAITSSVPNEGKSTVALELARSFSEMEKVLLIEADMRHPTLYKNLNLELHRPGLSNLLAKTHQINECIVRDKNLKLDILTSGISPANPLAFLSMKRFKMLIKVFGNFYDRIIIETPPVNAVSDAVIISKLVDSLLYIVHGGKTKREQISSGLSILRKVNAPVEGVIVNHSENIDTQKYQSKYYNAPGNIIKMPVRKSG